MSRGHPMLHFIFGMAIVCFPQTRGRRECPPAQSSLRYQRCGGTLHASEGDALQCYGENVRRRQKNWYCLWSSPGNSSGHTLVIVQNAKPDCTEYSMPPTPTPLKIESSTLHESKNMTAHVLDEKNSCTVASFRGVPRDFVRCGPPAAVRFVRRSRRLEANATWRREDEPRAGGCALRYRPLGGGGPWSESRSTGEAECATTTESPEPSLPYLEVQVRCIPGRKCANCTWSPSHTLPPELKVRPVILKAEDIDREGTYGSRLVLINWKFPSTEPVQGYTVGVRKASGEGPYFRFTTGQPEFRLNLSYSAYHLNITAVNNVSTSPALTHAIPARQHSASGAEVNATFHGNTSLTVSWRRAETPPGTVCYSVEIRRRGRKAQYSMFYEPSKEHRLIDLKEPLEPYQMYDITLHTRPNKNTCNMKAINSSERTYGSLQSYFREGTPVSAPTNITITNVTLTSAALSWRPVPVGELRGHLLGYTLHYKENDVTVGPALTTHRLAGLKGGAVYTVQMSAFTAAGAGPSSAPSYVETGSPDHTALPDAIRMALIFGATFTCTVLFGALLLKSCFPRAKKSFWPSIPNPGTSNAIQRMDTAAELEPLKPTRIQEDWDPCTLHPSSSGPRSPPRHTGLQGGGRLPGTPAGPARPDAGSAGDSSPRDDARTGTWDPPGDGPEDSPGTPRPDYTTMESFLLVSRNPASTSPSDLRPEGTDTDEETSGSDHSGHFSKGSDKESFELTCKF